MAKKVISLLLFIVLFAANSAFAFYEAGSLLINKSAETKTCVVDSRVLFVQDYSKILSDIRESMKNPFAAFSSDSVKNETIAKDSGANALITHNTYMMNTFEKFAGLQADPGRMFSAVDVQANSLYFLMFIMSFILLYIGLLRLFNANTINKNYIFVKPGFTY